MRQRKVKGLLVIGLCLVALAVTTGCATTARPHPQFQEKLASVKTVAIMPPGVTVYKLGVTGAPQVMEEETAAAKQIVSTAIEREPGRYAGVVFKPFPSPSALPDTDQNLTPAGQTELDDVQAFNFDYSLGPEVQRLAKTANADALLFSSGVNYIPTIGMAALETLGILMALYPGSGYPGVANPGFLHFSGPATPRPRGLSVALVDARTGALLWYNFFQGGSFTDPHSAADLVEQIFQGHEANLPAGW